MIFKYVLNSIIGWEKLWQHLPLFFHDFQRKELKNPKVWAKCLRNYEERGGRGLEMEIQYFYFELVLCNSFFA